MVFLLAANSILFLISIQIIQAEMRLENCPNLNRKFVIRASKDFITLMLVLGLGQLLTTMVKPILLLTDSFYLMQMFNMVESAFLSLQGFFVSLIFCYLNRWVITTAKIQWVRWRQQRRPGRCTRPSLHISRRSSLYRLLMHLRAEDGEVIQLGTLGCLYPSNSRRDFEQRRSSEVSRRQTPWSSQAREGSLQLFTQYSPITLAPIAPRFALDDCMVHPRRRQSRSMPLPNIARDDSESGSIHTGSVVVTTADIEREEGLQSTSFIFPPEMPRVEIVQHFASPQGKIQRQRSKSH